MRFVWNHISAFRFFHSNDLLSTYLNVFVTLDSRASLHGIYFIFVADFVNFLYIETRIAIQIQSFYGNHIICNHSNSNQFKFGAIRIQITSMWMVTELLSRLLTEKYIAIFKVTCHRTKFDSYFLFGLNFYWSQNWIFFFIFFDSKPFTVSLHSIGNAKNGLKSKRNAIQTRVFDEMHKPVKKERKKNECSKGVIWRGEYFLW